MPDSIVMVPTISSITLDFFHSLLITKAQIISRDCYERKHLKWHSLKGRKNLKGGHFKQFQVTCRHSFGKLGVALFYLA